MLPNIPGRSLYDPVNERAACGIGFIANIKGIRSHSVITDGLSILSRLEHRGACGADPETGDGAGILIQKPHEFNLKVTAELDIQIPDTDDYATGLVFLPPDKTLGNRLIALFETLIKENGQRCLGWRNVPQIDTVAGRIARSVAPDILQVFIERGDDTPTVDAFERKLYIIRKQVENRIRNDDLPGREYFHIPSLSVHTMVYKGLLLPDQIPQYFPDLTDGEMKSALALVHQRFSTNTFPTWDLAQPFRFLCHNGEINTLRANLNWLHAREKLFNSPLFGEDMKKIIPIATTGASDSAILDNMVELLYHTARSLPHCIAMLIPEAWENHTQMSDAKKAFYEYHSCIMEPWDGPAAIAFTNGKLIGATLDRNGLRPGRYTETKDGFIIMASETGVIDIEPENILHKGRLQPGKMLLVDLVQGRVVPDEEIKESLASRKPYRQWLNTNMLRLAEFDKPAEYPNYDFPTLRMRQRAFGYAQEDLRTILAPMGNNGGEAIGSMGTDTPLAVFSRKNPLLFDYFRQMFAQVTNPPLDAIREKLVTASGTDIGPELSLFEESELHCRQIRIKHLLLDNKDLQKICNHDDGILRAKTLSAVFEAALSGEGLKRALDELRFAAENSVRNGYSLLVLSDRSVDAKHAPIPALLAAAAVHHHLIRKQLRTRCGLIVESAEPREVHHFATLIAFGVSAVNPYLALATLAYMHRHGQTEKHLSLDEIRANYARAINNGVVKVMSKMGISTLDGYRGAQLVEAVGLNKALIEEFFPGTQSRIGGVGLDEIAAETVARHSRGYQSRHFAGHLELESGGKYQWRRNGEKHLNDPDSITTLQAAVRNNDPKTFAEFSELSNKQSRQRFTLRSMLDFKPCGTPIPVSEVEPAKEIVKRFKTGAMSFGSLSFEAHSNLAIAMNRLGGKSNSGEGGEDPIRNQEFRKRDSRMDKLAELSSWSTQNIQSGDSLRSAIKQVASGRFGVTSEYLVNCDELQIKMAQGAKPGEGGHLPGHKVNQWIGQTRHSTPGVSLISPPPHHDIYSIEDLAQLIHDLKNANHHARINVKLVSEAGVGTIAVGVAKAKADVILISGHDGGTGAAPLTSVKYAGMPWELGLAEAQQVLVMNNLRNRVILEADGQLRTGRDVAIAALLGAEEFGFATAPLIASGCIMMRKCHLNTCPVGVATQDPELRKKFAGKPEHVVNYMFFVAEELRQIMASLGFTKVDLMIGRADCLSTATVTDHYKTRNIDLTPILALTNTDAVAATRKTINHDHAVEKSLDATTLLPLAEPAIKNGTRVNANLPIRNTNRTVGTLTGSEITRNHGRRGLPADTVNFDFTGSAGQSFGAFIPHGMTMRISGDANDYFGKGLSGGKLAVYPPGNSPFNPDHNIIIGNAALYGATSGEAYICGVAGERFCVRNSGAIAVVEGVGDHGCEYMTGGSVLVLGRTGRNFAAGMSGGIAYVLDSTGDFNHHLCNHGSVVLESLNQPQDTDKVQQLIKTHINMTGSALGKRILENWNMHRQRFIKVLPIEYKRILEESAINTPPAQNRNEISEICNG